MLGSVSDSHSLRLIGLTIGCLVLITGCTSELPCSTQPYTAQENTLRSQEANTPRNSGAKALSVNSNSSKNSSNMTRNLEKISGLAYNGEEVSLLVSSNGCTRADDFFVQHEVTNRSCEVQVVRANPDNCRKAPQAIRINIAWQKPAKCVGSDLRFINPLLELQASSLGR